MPSTSGAYVGVYEVNNQKEIVAFSQIDDTTVNNLTYTQNAVEAEKIVPPLTIDGVTGGTENYTTTVTATPNTSGDTLYYTVSSSPASTPTWDATPWAGLYSAPTSGVNLSAPPQDYTDSQFYVQVYEVANINAGIAGQSPLWRIVAFNQVMIPT